MRARRTPRRGRTEERIDRLRRALAALGPAPRDALGRWTHQEQVWRLQRELDDLTSGRGLRSLCGMGRRSG